MRVRTFTRPDLSRTRARRRTTRQLGATRIRKWRRRALYERDGRLSRTARTRLCVRETPDALTLMAQPPGQRMVAIRRCFR